MGIMSQSRSCLVIRNPFAISSQIKKKGGGVEIVGDFT